MNQKEFSFLPLMLLFYFISAYPSLYKHIDRNINKLMYISKELRKAVEQRAQPGWGAPGQGEKQGRPMQKDS